jgi:hypothetical protein
LSVTLLSVTLSSVVFLAAGGSRSDEAEEVINTVAVNAASQAGVEDDDPFIVGNIPRRNINELPGLEPVQHRL